MTAEEKNLAERIRVAKEIKELEARLKVLYIKSRELLKK